VDFQWSDVGTWKALAEELGVGANVTQVTGGEVLLHDASGNLVQAGERPIVLLGVHGLVVIDAGDAVLVSSLERSPEVREVVSRLRKRDRRDLI
jgi:mannose-1-phosphate guanylyltransferase